MGLVRFLECVLALVVLIALVVFSVSNRSQLEINLFPFPFVLEVPVYIALIGVLIVGIAIGGLVGYISNFGTRLTLRSLIRRQATRENRFPSSKRSSNAFHSPESGS